MRTNGLRDHVVYLERLCKQILETVKRRLSESLETSEDKSWTSQLYREVAHHVRFCHERWVSNGVTVPRRGWAWFWRQMWMWSRPGLTSDSICHDDEPLNIHSLTLSNLYTQKICMSSEESTEYKYVLPVLIPITEMCSWFFFTYRVKKFHGRKDILTIIKSYIRSNTRLPLVLYGKTGSGKSAIIAKAAKEINKWCRGYIIKNFSKFTF